MSHYQSSRISKSCYAPGFSWVDPTRCHGGEWIVSLFSFVNRKTYSRVYFSGFHSCELLDETAKVKYDDHTD